jgi:hypothetical protein
VEPRETPGLRRTRAQPGEDADGGPSTIVVAIAVAAAIGLVWLFRRRLARAAAVLRRRTTG